MLLESFVFVVDDRNRICSMHMLGNWNKDIVYIESLRNGANWTTRCTLFMDISPNAFKFPYLDKKDGGLWTSRNSMIAFSGLI